MRKIEIFVNGVYMCTTTQSKTCREAREKFLRANPQYASARVQAFFEKK
jgi:hypothetical protein